MNILSSLGIDINLLIAQIINFVLLLWLLAMLVYKPIVKRIEKDEAELQQVQAKEKLLEEEKKSFSLQKAAELSDANRRAKEIIKEAEGIAEGSKKQAGERMEIETAQMIEGTKTALKSQRPMIEKELLEDMKTKINGNFQTSFNGSLTPKQQKEIQDILFENLIEQIEAISIPKIKDVDILTLEEAKKSNNKSQFKKLIQQKIGPIVLEYVFNVTPKQKNEIEKIISEKSGTDIDVDLKQNKNLINGFRFEAMGIVFESNFSNLIKNATSLEN